MHNKWIWVFVIGSVLSLLVSRDALAEGGRQKAEIIIPENARSSYENWGYAPAVKIGNTIYVSGVVTVLRGEGSYEERYARGFKDALEWIDEILREAGASLDDVVDITSFHTDLQRQLQTAIKVRMAHMNMPHPAWTAVGTTALASPDGVTEIKVVAVID